MIDAIILIAGALFDMFLVITYYSKLFRGKRKDIGKIMFYSGRDAAVQVI